MIQVKSCISVLSHLKLAGIIYVQPENFVNQLTKMFLKFSPKQQNPATERSAQIHF